MPQGRRRKSTQVYTTAKIIETESQCEDNRSRIPHAQESAVSEYDTVTTDDICEELTTSLSSTEAHVKPLGVIDGEDVDMTLKTDIEMEAVSTAQIAIRSSTRVSKPPRRETYSPPHSPVKKQCKVSVIKEVKCVTPKTKRTWELWSADDKNIFFEGLAEYGKDFDSIQNLIAQKYKKKGTDPKMLKNKDQVRHFYYRTWHKIAEYAPPRDSAVKKRVQELYGLINYGELRKKIRGTLNEKGGKKLTELIHTGVTTIKVRGKNIRLRTPVCKALKKINRIDDKKIRAASTECHIPDKITAELTPRDNGAWSYVQTMAQNPRVHLTLRPESKLVSVVAFLEKKWRPLNLKKRESLMGGDEWSVPRSLRVYAHSDCEVTPVSVGTAKQQPPLQLHFDSYLTNVLGIVRPHPATPTEPETGANSENSLSGHEGGVYSSPEPRIHTVVRPATDPDSPSETKPSTIVDKTSVFNRLLKYTSPDTPAPDTPAPDTPVPDTKLGDADKTSVFNRLLQYTLDNIHTVDTKPSNSDKPNAFDSVEATSKSLRSLNSSVNVDDETAQFPEDSSTPARDTEPVKDDDVDEEKACLGCNDNDADDVDLDDGVQDAPMDMNEDADERGSTVNVDRDAVLRRFETGWSKNECEELSLAELYVMFGKRGTLRMQYRWSDDSTPDPGHAAAPKFSKTLTQLLVVATAQFTDLTAKARATHDKAPVLCSKCSATVPNKPAARKPTKPSQDPSECRDAVFRVPTQPVKSVPFVQTSLPQDERLPKVSSGQGVRPRVTRKQILVQRRLLPKSPQLMAYTVPAPQASLIQLHASPTSLLSRPQQQAVSVPVVVSQIVTASRSLVNSHTSLVSSAATSISLQTVPSLSTATSTLSTESSHIFPALTATNCPMITTSTPITDRTHNDLNTTISPTNLSALLDISLPAPTNLSESTTDRFLDIAFGNSNSSFTGLLEVGGEGDRLTVFKLGVDHQWLNGEGADISLSSLLTESPSKRSQEPETSAVPPVNLFSDNSRDFLSNKHDVDSHIQLIMNESSVDLVSKFADIAAQLAREPQPST